MDYVIINLDEVHEIVEKNKDAFIGKVKRFPHSPPFGIDIESMEIPDWAISSKSMMKEFLKQRLYELSGKYKLWAEK